MQLPQNDWRVVLGDCWDTPNFKALDQFVAEERRRGVVYPAEYHVFQALDWTPFNETRVVILGQDPYHEPGQAMGASFAVPNGVPLPPSLRNIYRELQSDCGIAPSASGNLRPWAEQGVLLLNTVLTVRAHAANSHAGHGWEALTDTIIGRLSARGGVVFVLWGKPAQKKRRLIDTATNAVVMSPHPSPLSAYRGFFGSRPFSKINEELNEMKQKAIDWRVV